MTKTQKIILIIAGILAIGSVAFAIFALVQPKSQPVAIDPTSDCPLSGRTVTYPGKADHTALQILTSLCNVTLNADGTAPTTIEHVTATSPAYWALYVDDQPALTPANQLQTQPTQTITWQLETIDD